MTDLGVEARPARTPFRPALRLLFADRLGLVFLAWLLIAFVLRPLMMDAHFGAGGAIGEWLRGRMDTVALSRMAGAVQWGSLTGLVLVIALAHVRLGATMPGMMASVRARFLVGLAYAVGLTVGYVLFIWTPVTAVSLMLHDTFIFYDAIHRIDHGQRPSIDFPTPLGAAMLYLPWLGSKISGGYAGAIEISSAIVALGLCVACAQACASRHGAAIGAVLVAAIFLMVVPSMLEGYGAPDSQTIEGGVFQGITEEYANAMFYNRWGWGALIAVFAFLTPRKDGEAAQVAETVTLGLILAFLFWLKLSYFVVGGAAAVLFAFLGAKPWRTLAIGGAVAGGAILMVALLTGNLFAYIGDITLAGRVSGARFSGLAELIKDNLLDLLLALSPVVAMGLMSRLKAVDLWVTGLILLGTLFVINQNAQISGLPTLLVVSAYAVWRLRDESERGLKLLAVMAFVLPAATYMLDRASGLLGQTSVARREEARPAPAWASIPALKNVYAEERENVLATVEAAGTLAGKQDAFADMAMYQRRQYLRSAEYLATLQAGIDELKPVMGPNDSVVEMDFASPLAFLMNARPAKGYWITFDDGRTISGDVYPKAEMLFADADHVMMPKMYVEPDTAMRMKLLYSKWLDTNYAERSESRYWVRWSHRKPALQPATQLAVIP